MDVYDWWPKRTSSNWNSTLLTLDQWGGPRGLEQWRRFAESHGKPLALSEWGLDASTTTDNPFFIQKMNEWFRAHAGTGAGKLLYEVRRVKRETIEKKRGTNREGNKEKEKEKRRKERIQEA